MVRSIKKSVNWSMAAGLLIVLLALAAGCGSDSGGTVQTVRTYGGNYAGTWTDAAGTLTGTWSFNADDNGDLTGVVSTDGYAETPFSGEGAVQADGSFEFQTTGTWSFIMEGRIDNTDSGKIITAAVSGDVTGTANGETGVRFAVFTDPHYYDTDLGTTGQAFEEYLAADRKLLRESPAILDATISAILDRNPQFVIVSGDLTKDGAESSHREIASGLARFEADGTEVFVVPGNHDINNPHAVSFNGATTTPVANVDPDEFVEIYNDLGYSQALYRDPASLSYVAEPAENIWLLALDSCIYDQNEAQGHPTTGGRFSDETMAWIQARLAEAEELGKTVIAAMHHGLVEHFTGQSVFFADYVIQNWPTVSATLAADGLPLVFTGHYHSQDVTLQTFEQTEETESGSPLVFDVETGSLVTYPCPYRMVSLGESSKQAVLRTYRIQEIDYDTGGLDFQNYAQQYLREGLLPQVILMLMYQLGVPQEKAVMVAPDGVDAMVAHYAGDEIATPEIWIKIGEYSQDPDLQIAAQLMASFYTDLTPADNNVGFSIQTGDIQ